MLYSWFSEFFKFHVTPVTSTSSEAQAPHFEGLGNDVEDCQRASVPPATPKVLRVRTGLRRWRPRFSRCALTQLLSVENYYLHNIGEVSKRDLRGLGRKLLPFALSDQKSEVFGTIAEEVGKMWVTCPYKRSDVNWCWFCVKGERRWLCCNNGSNLGIRRCCSIASRDASYRLVENLLPNS